MTLLFFPCNLSAQKVPLVWRICIGARVKVMKMHRDACKFKSTCEMHTYTAYRTHIACRFEFACRAGWLREENRQNACSLLQRDCSLSEKGNFSEAQGAPGHPCAAGGCRQGCSACQSRFLILGAHLHTKADLDVYGHLQRDLGMCSKIVNKLRKSRLGRISRCTGL
jgi:hypothetical protein